MGADSRDLLKVYSRACSQPTSVQGPVQWCRITSSLLGIGSRVSVYWPLLQGQSAVLSTEAFCLQPYWCLSSATCCRSCWALASAHGHSPSWKILALLLRQERALFTFLFMVGSEPPPPGSPPYSSGSRCPKIDSLILFHKSTHISLTWLISDGDYLFIYAFPGPFQFQSSKEENLRLSYVAIQVLCLCLMLSIAGLVGGWVDGWMENSVQYSGKC